MEEVTEREESRIFGLISWCRKSDMINWVCLVDINIVMVMGVYSSGKNQGCTYKIVGHQQLHLLDFKVKLYQP